jgi:hypothetical protein
MNQSLDLDSNLASRFVQRFPDREDQRVFLEREMRRTIRQYFEHQNPVRFELTNLQVRTYPPNKHPMGWDAFKVKIKVNDLSGACLECPRSKSMLQPPRNSWIRPCLASQWPDTRFTLTLWSESPARNFERS